jgi:hypothetical protein
MLSCWRTILVSLGCLLCAVGRFLIPGHALSLPGTYEAFAHLWVGGLLGAWCCSRNWRLLAAVGLLSVLEVVLFLLR